MNTILSKKIPSGEFEEVSIERPEWKAEFLSLVEQGKRIKYDVYNMPTIAKEIKVELSKRGYRDVILERDHDQHFLVPNSN